MGKKDATFQFSDCCQQKTKSKNRINRSAKIFSSLQNFEFLSKTFAWKLGEKTNWLKIKSFEIRKLTWQWGPLVIIIGKP